MNKTCKCRKSGVPCSSKCRSGRACGNVIQGPVARKFNKSDRKSLAKWKKRESYDGQKAVTQNVLSLSFTCPYLPLR